MQIWLTILSFFVYGSGSTIESSTVSFGVIRNTSLKIPQGNTTTVNGTCETCVCALVSNPSLFSFNCFENNLTCEMYSKADQDQPCSLLDFVTSAFYFLSLPTSKLTTVATRECLESGYFYCDGCFFSSHVDPVDSTGISLDLRLDLSRLVNDLHWHTDGWCKLLVNIHHRLRIVSLAAIGKEPICEHFLSPAEAVQSIVDVRGVDLSDEQRQWN